MKILNEKKPWWKTYINKKKVLDNLKRSVIDNHITFGKNCLSLEKKLKKFLKVKNVILTNSGTSALFMATLASNIHRKKKVFSPVMTWSGTINGALYANKKLSFIDNKKDTINANYKSILDKIKKNDILFMTHLNGKCAYSKYEYKELKKKKIFIIEDAAQSFMCKDFNNNYLGTQFDIGCFSLSYTKMCNMVYGGFCVTNNNNLAKSLRKIRNNGVDNDIQIATAKGGNFKPNDLNACVGLFSLSIKNKIKKKLTLNYNFYKKKLNNEKIKILDYPNLNKEFPTYIEVLVENRKKLIKFLNKKKIGYSYTTRNLAISKHLKVKKKFKNAEEIDNKILRLPSGTGYKISELNKIVKLLNRY